MKILIVAPSVIPLGGNRYGGIEKLCYDFVEQLNKRGHEVSVCAPYGSIVPNGVQLLPTVRLPEEQDRDDIVLALPITELDKFEVIHDFSHGHKFSRFYGKLPIISMLWDPIVRRYNKAPYNIVCLSNWQKERFEEAYKPQGAIVMPPMVNTDKYKPDPNAKRERFLFLGKISPEKGVLQAIQYAKELDVPLDVIGGLIPSESTSPYLFEVKNQISVAKAQGFDIEFHWNIMEEEKIKFLQNAKAVIYPVQQDEAHWLVGVEAWACNTETIMFDRGSMREIHAPFSWLPKTDAEFKDAMQKIMFNVPRMSYLTNESFTIDRYSPEVVIPQYEMLYEEVSRGGRW